GIFKLERYRHLPALRLNFLPRQNGTPVDVDQPHIDDRFRRQGDSLPIDEFAGHRRRVRVATAGMPSGAARAGADQRDSEQRRAQPPQYWNQWQTHYSKHPFSLSLSSCAAATASIDRRGEAASFRPCYGTHVTPR